MVLLVLRCINHSWRFYYKFLVANFICISLSILIIYLCFPTLTYVLLCLIFAFLCNKYSLILEKRKIIIKNEHT